MKKSRAIFQTMIFFLVLVIPSLLWGIFSIAGLQEKLSFDTGENRNLHTVSSEVSLSNLTSELEQTYDDHVPFRSILLRLHQKTENLVEKPYSNAIEPVILAAVNRKSRAAAEETAGEVILPPQNTAEAASKSEDPTAAGQDAAAQNGHVHNFEVVEHRDADFENYGYTRYRCSCGQEKEEYIDKPVDDSFFPFKEVGNGVILGRFGWLFLSETVDDFTGANLFDDSTLAALASQFVMLRDLCKTKGIDVKYIFFPDKCLIYGEYFPTMERADYSRLHQLEDYMKANTDLDLDYVYEEILAGKPYHRLYHKLDTHWNAWGALIAVNALYRMLGLPQITEDMLNPTVAERGSGDLVAISGYTDVDMNADQEWALHYKQDVESTIQVSIEWEGNFQVFTSDAAIDKTVVLIGDSYNYVIMNFLACDYSRVVYVNWGYIDQVDPEIIRDADILIVDEVERFSSILITTTQKLIGIFSE